MESQNSVDPTSERRRYAAAITTAVLVAAGYTVAVLWWRAQFGEGVPSPEIHETEYPNLIYALRSMQRGYGLLWNSLQNCGQPFLPTSLLGLPYPIHILFLLIDMNTAYLLSAGLHLAIAGIGGYWLGRELGLGHIAALCGALAFELGGDAIGLLTWVPTVIFGIYIWMPWALLLCERILKAPSIDKGICLGIILTLQLLCGYPQFMIFTYQFIALRVIWELTTRRPAQWLGMLGATALAFTLPAFLGGIQLFPMIEYMHESVRLGPLSFDEMNPGLGLTWESFRTFVGHHTETSHGTTFAVAAAALAALAPFAPSNRRVVLFYLFAGGLFLALAFDNPLLAFYRQLPIGSTFRLSSRFIYVTAFAFSVLVGVGTDVVTRVDQPHGRQRLALLAAPIVGGAALFFLSTMGLRNWEWVLFGATVSICAGAILLRIGVRMARLSLPVLLCVNLLIMDWSPYGSLPKDAAPLYAKSAAFSFVRDRLTPQDRIIEVGRFGDVSLEDKSATIFDTPSIIDHEPQTARRYADIYVMLMRNEEMKSINQFYYPLTAVPKNRPLLNFLSARYIIADPTAEALTPLMHPPLKWLSEVTTGQDNRSSERARVDIYENMEALPRAFYVPRLEVRDPREALRLLASETHDPRRVALVEAIPADGFTGANPSGTGSVTIVRDRSEQLALHVTATAEGFLSLTDQYYPGWEASVNGVPAVITRANHAFRVVRVPAGESIVVFSYHPVSVLAGVVVSLITLTALGGFVGARTWRARRRGRLAR